jgi:hypothetical protein
MELFSAFLTGVFYCVLIDYWRRDTTARARREAGPLLAAITLSRSTRIWRAAAMLCFGALALLPGVVLVATGIGELSGMVVFTWTVMVFCVADFWPWRRDNLEVRENAIVLTKPNVVCIPWREITSCRWGPVPGRLVIERGGAKVKCRVAPDQVDSATAVLSQHVEVSAHGIRLASPTFNLDGSVRTGPRPEHREVIFRRLQFDLRTMFLLMLAASAAFGWLGINYRSGKDQEAVVAGLAAFQPDERWVGYDVFWLDFSKSKTKPGDDDLIYLGQLRRMQTLDLTDAPVTDAGLKYLYGLTRLRSVYLNGTEVTQQGVAALQRALPKANIGWWRRNLGPQALTAPPPPPSSPPPPADPPDSE